MFTSAGGSTQKMCGEVHSEVHTDIEVHGDSEVQMEKRRIG